METIEKIKNIIEALLIVSEEGLKREDIKNAIPDSEIRDIEDGIRLLKEEYAGANRAFNISEIAERYRIVTKPEYKQWINNLYQKKIERLSKPSLETLAIIAYKQPVTKTEIEGVRGVNTDGVLKTLLEKELIQIKGRRDVVGHPIIYGTTNKFMEMFGLNSTGDLPALKSFSETDLEFQPSGPREFNQVKS